ncbi:hypothetical protein Taro_006450 [Colocasia esculenta]|uniref:S phase cyclin A-associated protein in the endoplasmic reticulum N-terminal domain-containing protein n=1 Tax=Colocasia esculenta TaxID=4460 RepID=A0A843TX30_COLES|nr:hypothetical protein [Colocasia esculenta]
MVILQLAPPAPDDRLDGIRLALSRLILAGLAMKVRSHRALDSGFCVLVLEFWAAVWVIPDGLLVMENNAVVDENDQGSGWFERHKSSSRLSTQYVSGGSSGKIYSADPRHREAGNSHKVRQTKYPGQGLDTVLGTETDGNCGSGLEEANERAGCPDKEIVRQDTADPRKVTESIGERAAIVKISKEEEINDVPKIKWGDLDDFTMKLSEQAKCSLGASKIGCDDNDALPKKENVTISDGSVSHDSPCSLLQKGRPLTASKDVEQFPDGRLSSFAVEESFEENWKEVLEIPSENVRILGSDTDVTCLNNKVETPGEIRDNCTTSEYEHRDGLPLITSSSGACSSVSLEEVIMMTLDGPGRKSVGAAVDVSKLSIIHGKSSMSASCWDTASHLDYISAQEDTLAVANEDRKGLQVALPVIDDLGGVEVGESKERFRQRLWCFLFENLNRAIDELYLLCELECDMEQTEEAILVLDEAGSDFRELKSRVEGFENTKRFPSQLTKEGMTSNVKSDHRRPHALSWEVRRMTTTPNRAEILSSSIEAFKKIQQERADKYAVQDLKVLSGSQSPDDNLPRMNDTQLEHKNIPKKGDAQPNTRAPSKPKKHSGVVTVGHRSTISDTMSTSNINSSRAHTKDGSKSSSKLRKGEHLEPISETEKKQTDKDKVLGDIRIEKQLKSVDMPKKQSLLTDKEKEKQNLAPWKSMDAWKEKRNWADILRSPMRSSSRVSHSPGMGRKSMDRARVLHDKLMSPEKKKKTALDMKKEAEERHARAMRIRNQLENERVQRLQRTSEKLNRVNEWQAVRSLKLRERMHARHLLSESRHEAYLAQVARRAGDESSKVNEVRFITSLNEENKKLILRQKLHDSELRRAEKLQVIRTKQKEDMVREGAVLERRKLLEAEKLQRIAETQRRKEEAKVRREEERKASSAAREAKAVEQLRRKEVRAKAQQEEAELLAQKLAERLRESEQRRKFYLEQIREKASMDFRDQSSPLLRRPLNKEGQGRSISANIIEEYQTVSHSSTSGPAMSLGDATQQQPMKRRIKKIRQRLMALKHDFDEPSLGAEFVGFAYRSTLGAARAKIGRWLQDLQRFRQARKEGAASIGLIVGDMIKYLEGKEPELHASRQAGLIDFIASALPASHTSKPEACQVTRYFLRLLRTVLSATANRSYFLSQNLLPPLIPMLSACLENYIKIAASSNLPGTIALLSNKTSAENLEMTAEVLDGFLWIITTILGHNHSDDLQLQMLNGSIELVVAYQIIHRLRDLFALYDRPQIEGSPFPLSIILSLDLLAVLTSGSGAVCSIDWGSYLSKALPENGIPGALVEKSLDTLGTQDVTVLDCKSRDFDSASVSAPVDACATYVDPSSQTDGGQELSPDIACPSNIPEKSSFDRNGRNKASDISREMGNNRPAPDRYPHIISKEESKTTVSLPNGNSTADVGGERCNTYEPILQDNDESRKEVLLKQHITFLVSAISETGLVSLPSLLTAVLLQANNRLTSEQTSYTLPSNFEEVAIGVLKVLNNVALLDINLLQNMLARPDLQMEFFHLMSFLLSHCNSKWKAVNDQVGLLLLESLLLLGYFALFHPGNQEVLRWGKNPTILHKVCDLPFVFFSDPELTPILAGTLVAACYGCEQNRDVVQQELSVEMLISLLKSCQQESLRAQHNSLASDASTAEPKKPQGDCLLRTNGRSTSVPFGKGVMSGSNRNSKTKSLREGKLRTCDDWALKHNLPASGAASAFMLHSRLPSILIDKAEEFFSAAVSRESV